MKVFVPTNLVKVNIHSTSKILRPGRVKRPAQISPIKMVLRINAVHAPNRKQILLPRDARTSTASNAWRT